jgi:hypothetical protein
MLLGTWLSFSQGAKPVPVYMVSGIGTVYIGLIALVANILVAAIGTAIADRMNLPRSPDRTVADDYADTTTTES